MIFKISSLLTFAFALSSLDVATAKAKQPKSVGITLLPEGKKMWVFCYPICAAMLKPRSYLIIDSIAVHVGFLTTPLPIGWAVFIFSLDLHDWNFLFFRLLPYLSRYVRLRMVMNVMDLHLLLLAIWRWIPLQQERDGILRRGWGPGERIRYHCCGHSELKICASGVAYWFLSS